MSLKKKNKNSLIYFLEVSQYCHYYSISLNSYKKDNKNNRSLCWILIIVLLCPHIADKPPFIQVVVTTLVEEVQLSFFVRRHLPSINLTVVDEDKFDTCWQFDNLLPVDLNVFLAGKIKKIYNSTNSEFYLVGNWIVGMYALCFSNLPVVKLCNFLLFKFLKFTLQRLLFGC